MSVTRRRSTDSVQRPQVDAFHRRFDGLRRLARPSEREKSWPRLEKS